MRARRMPAPAARRPQPRRNAAKVPDVPTFVPAAVKVEASPRPHTDDKTDDQANDAIRRMIEAAYT